MITDDMNVHCADCDHTFLLSPDGATASVACPSCGGKRLERDQPSPTNSDGDLRNVPTPSDGGLGLDQGGNPLQEGFAGQVDGGWQPWRRRDESFASVKTANDGRIMEATPPAHIAGLHAKPLGLLSRLNSVHIDGTHVTPDRVGYFFSKYGMPDSPHYGKPVQVETHDPAFTQLAVKIINDGHGDPPAYQQDIQAIQAGIKAGTVQPPPKTASVHTADWGDDFDFDKTPVHKFVIDNSGGVYSLPNPTTHEKIADHHGLHDLGFPHKMSLGELNDDNTTDWYQHDTGHSPQALESMLYGHYGHPVVVEPTLKPTTNEERWGIEPGRVPGQEGSKRELDILNAPPKTRWNGTVPLDRNEGLVRGGRTLNMDPYTPWEYPSEEEITKITNRHKANPLALLAPIAGALGLGGAEAAGGSALVGGLMRGALFGQGSNMVKGLNQPQSVPQNVPENVPQGVRDVSQLSHVTADIETPHTNPGYHDTEDGDTKQFNDQDHGTEFQNPNNDAEAGGAAQGEDNVDGGIGPEQPSFSPGTLEQVHQLLPSLLDHFNSPESAANDPVIRQLHEQLEKENPGYLEQGDDNAVKELIQKLREPSAVSASVHQGFDWNQSPNQPDVAPGTINFAPGAGQGKCVYCGGVTGPDGSCPQCGAKNNPVDQLTQPGTQQIGPHQSQPPPGYTPMPGYTGAALGHCHHCGAVTDASGICPQCGAQSPSVEGTGAGALTPSMQAKVAADHQGPVTDEQKKAVAELLIDSQRHEEIPHMLEAPWDYADELAQVAQKTNVVPNIDPNEQPPAPPVQEIAPPGATMPVPNPADPSMQGQMVSKVAGPEDMGSINPDGGPSEAPVEPNVEPQNDSRTWVDDSGQDLVEGQQYEIHNPKYQIPDIVTVVKVKPDSILVDNNGYQHEITSEEAQNEGLTYTPSSGDEGPEGSPEDAQIDPNAPPAPVNTQQEEVPNIPSNLSHVDDDACPRCASQHFASSMSSPTTTFHECYKCSHAWETKEKDYIDRNTAGREWIKEDSPHGDDFFAEYERVKNSKQTGSRNLSDIAARDPRLQSVKETLEANAQERTAGKKFTPREQREFIDEQGVARNADKLDLEGTHYESHRYLGEKTNGMNAPDEHLFLGI